jgi:hypothetical protein
LATSAGAWAGSTDRLTRIRTRSVSAAAAERHPHVRVVERHPFAARDARERAVVGEAAPVDRRRAVVPGAHRGQRDSDVDARTVPGREPTRGHADRTGHSQDALALVCSLERCRR